MNRPGVVPLVILAVFGIVGVIEFRTVLSMLGVDVSANVYFPVAGAVLILAFAALMVLTERNDGSDSGKAGKVGS